MSENIAEMRSLQSVEGQPLRSTCGEGGIPTELSALKRDRHGIRLPDFSRRLAVSSAWLSSGRRSSAMLHLPR